jgi:hypothetical protein
MRSELLVAGVRERLINPATGTAARQHSRVRVSIIGGASLPWAWRELKAAELDISPFDFGSRRTCHAAQILPSVAVSTEGSGEVTFGCSSQSRQERRFGAPQFPVERGEQLSYNRSAWLNP